MCPTILNPPPTSFPTSSLWVVPEHWLWMSCFIHWTYTGHYFTYGNIHVSMLILSCILWIFSEPQQLGLLHFPRLLYWLCFPSNSAGKESTCNAGDPGWIPGSGRFPREGIGYPLQYSLASLVAQMVKNVPARWETWVWSLGWEDPLEEGMATHSSIIAWRIPMDRGAWWATVHEVAKSLLYWLINIKCIY